MRIRDDLPPGVFPANPFLALEGSQSEETTERYVVGAARGFYENKWGTYEAEIYYPANKSGGNRPPNLANAPYAAVVFAHGFGANAGFYRTIGNQLAGSGYVALLYSAPNPVSIRLGRWSDGISSGITYLNDLSSANASPLSGMVDATKIGAMGHSMGGAGAILATASDSRIKATVALAPAHSRPGWFIFAKALNAAKTVKAPVQIQVGSKDNVTPKDLVHRYYANLPSLAAKEYVEIEGGGHLQFSDSHSAGLRMLEVGATTSHSEQHEISASFFTAWFHYFLRGERSFETYIFGARAQAAKAAGLLSALEWVKP